MHYMEIGGAETSLIGLLQSLDYSKIDVDLFLYAHRGEMMKYIPKEVNILPEIKVYANIESPMKNALKNGHLRLVIARIRAKLKYERYAKKKKPIDRSGIFQYVDDEVCKVLPSLNKHITYDLAISFVTPHGIVLKKINAKKKICWIHTDYTKIDVDVKKELLIWSSYDNIISISQEVTKSFLHVFPSLKGKIVQIENMLSPSFVRSRADEFNAKEELKKEASDSLILLSIGRFSYPKNFDNIPYICRRLITHLSSDNSQLKIKWFIIGYGGDEQLIRKKIIENDMNENVIILGKKANPYPYIKACDIYVQPSRYEGKSVTVREAQMLCKPVVITDYPTAKSQIQDGIDGRIVPIDNDGCADRLLKFILDTDLQAKITNYLYTHEYGNMTEIKKLHKLI